MAKKTEYEIALMVGGKVQASFGNSIRNVEQGINSLNNMAHTAAAAITSAFAAVKVGQFVGDAVNTYSSFEQAMATTAATANATQNEYEKLEKAALEMGKKTTKTATESAEALGYMALAGWDVDTSIEALEPVLRLSEATQMDLARCSDLVTDSMSALGLSVDNLSGYLDVCTAANNNANTTAEALMEAFIGCGGAAKTVGADLLDTATALGVLANNGTKGAEAGTALNSMLVRISSKDVAINAMKDLGVSAFDAAGNFIGLNEVLVQLSDAMADMTTEQKTAYMSSIAGTNYYTEMSYLLDSVAESADGTASAWDTLSTSLENSDGALLNMASTVTDTLSTSFQILNSATEDAQIHLVDAFGDDLKGVVLDLAAFIPNVTNDFIQFADKSQLKISKVFNNLQKDASVAWKMLLNLGSGVIENFDTIEMVVTGIGTAFITYKIISLLVKGASAAISFGNAIKMVAVANPVLFSITAATTAIIGITAAVKKAEEQAVASNLAGHFGDIALSLDDVQQIADYLVSSQSLVKVQESLAAFSELDGIRSSMEQNLKAINKMNWKVSIGMELSQSDKEAYLNDIESYINDANEYFTQERYAASISLSAFADGTVGRQNIISGIDSFYADVYTELQGAGTRLSNIVNDAFEDNFLDIDETKAIAQAQESMARIMNSLATSKFDAKLEIMSRQFSAEDLDAESFQALQEELNTQVEAAKEGYEDAWQQNLAMAKAALDYGSITQGEYDTAVDEFYQDYLSKVTEAELKAYEFQLNTINNAYSDEISSYNDHIQDVLEKYQGDNFRDVLENNPQHLMYSVMQDAWDNDIPKSTKQAMASLLDAMGGATEELELLKKQWEEVGEVPDDIAEMLAQSKNLSAMTVYQKTFGGQAGDKEALYDDLLQQIVNNDSFSDLEKSMRDNGMTLPDKIVEGAEEALPTAFNGLYAYSKDYLQSVFSQGMDVSTDININLNPVYFGSRIGLIDEYNAKLTERKNDAVQNALSRNGQELTDNINDFAFEPTLIGHADGGIFTVPHVARFVEDGPEAAIPLDGSSNAIALWSKVGRLLGVLDGSSSKSRSEELADSIGINNDSAEVETNDSSRIVYAPKITIEGNASREDIDSALSLSFEQFKDYMEQYMSERNRVSFAAARY